ncbi:SH3 domain-containing protein 19 isoform X1 [Anopheles moucheti]|uniref:SH3 domain-containing protein 19 isoform X1 n=1 Tax=Anopheles moucheti TaxID=186751 RepID=UPI0022F10161|nr:SH3 domain-containing protein 19 isoform X1 [Anopheles moucheti]
MCDILAAISYSYGYNERPRKRVKINMTIPSRPAPPPPQRNTTAPLRYTPTTDWDFCAFDSSSASSSQLETGSGQGFPVQQSHNVKAKKPPPPRPPPPKLSAAPTAPLKKPNQPQSINILSSLFGHKRGSNGATTSKPVGGPKHNLISGPVKLLPPPSTKPVPGKVSNFTTFTEHHNSSSSSSTNQLVRSTGTGPTALTEMQLISFDSPPSSPTFTQKSCSDCISVDSFSSDSNYSSPNNGNMSQAESGFEDDFVACGSNNRPQPGASVLWGDLDPFDGGHGTAAPTPVIYGTLPLASSATAQIRAPLINSKLQQSDFVDPLCNGQSVLPKVPIISMPTIIKPPTTSNPESQKSTPSHSAHTRNFVGAPKIIAATTGRGYAGMEDDFTPDTGAFDSLTSHPMPSVPPPPPPPLSDELYTEEPYGIALYDFQGEADEDLSFKTNEKIYLLKRLNNEWYMGRDKRGLEGMFPVNYVEVKVPLAAGCASQESPHSNEMSSAVKVRALYSFKAEAPEDLTIMENDYVAVLYQITSDWLYGEIDGRKGQFPANYIAYVPPNLPQMPVASS